MSNLIHSITVAAIISAKLSVFYYKSKDVGDLEVDLEVNLKGDFKQDLEGDLLSSLGQ